MVTAARRPRSRIFFLLLSCAVIAALALPTAAFAQSAQALLNEAHAARDAGDVGKAKDLFQQIIDKHPGTLPAGHALLGLARLHSGAYEHERAYELLEKILDDYSDPAVVGPALWDRIVIPVNRLQQYDRATEVAEKYFAEAAPQLWPDHRRDLVALLMRAYRKSHQPQQAIKLYTDYVRTTPSLLAYTPALVELVRGYASARKFDEVPTIARIAYALCDFEQKAIEKVSAAVRQALRLRGLASGGGLEQAAQFFEAQEDPDAPNPLAEAKMPELSEENLAAMLKAAGQDTHARISVYLYAGKYEQAMMEAMAASAEAPTDEMAAAIAEIARVFKAKDLNLVRGNQFIEYAKTGEGENPVPGFFEGVRQ